MNAYASLLKKVPKYGYFYGALSFLCRKALCNLGLEEMPLVPAWHIVIPQGDQSLCFRPRGFDFKAADLSPVLNSDLYVNAIKPVQEE